ncbi:phasin family protein [Brevundimonas nasdae]|uniref:phasin family protein n=1 Tax=Brevundimonas nasdae TaxID=172043 RepID=UPI001FD17E9A|nr:phasin family protein [Brevundimonas nasdae]
MIAARTTRMAQDLTNPKGQDLKELSLMSTEKAAAMTASANAVAASAGAIGQRLGRAAMDEGAIAMRAAASLAEARTPVEAATAQFRYALGWWGRATAQAVTLNSELMRAQAEAIAPIHKTATANARRLRKKS